MPEKKTFWMVWTSAGHAPRARHETLELAQKEADRLARNNVGTEFVVLKSVYSYHAKAMLTIEQHYDQAAEDPVV